MKRGHKISLIDYDSISTSKKGLPHWVYINDETYIIIEKEYNDKIVYDTLASWYIKEINPWKLDFTLVNNDDTETTTIKYHYSKELVKVVFESEEQYKAYLDYFLVNYDEELEDKEIILPFYYYCGYDKVWELYYLGDVENWKRYMNEEIRRDNLIQEFSKIERIVIL